MLNLSGCHGTDGHVGEVLLLLVLVLGDGCCVLWTGCNRSAARPQRRCLRAWQQRFAAALPPSAACCIACFCARRPWELQHCCVHALQPKQKGLQAACKAARNARRPVKEASHQQGVSRSKRQSSVHMNRRQSGNPVLAAGQVERILQYYGEDRCTHTSLHMVLHCPATPVQHRAAGTSGNEHRCFRPRRHLQPARWHRQRDPAICSPRRTYRARLLDRAVVGVVLSLKTTIAPAMHSRKASATHTGLVLARVHQAETHVSLLQPLSARHSS